MNAPTRVMVDWGTSNLRIWLLDASGAVLRTHVSEDGMGRLEPSRFSGVLEAALAGWGLGQKDEIDIVVCGMAGARNGWMEAPYLDVPADLAALMSRAARPPMPAAGWRVAILPGICRRAPGAEDVMRGEETQLLGLGRLLPGYSGPVCLPGTHSKWAVLDGTVLRSFSTAMTGELHHLLRTSSVLRHTVAAQEGGQDWDGGFEAGAQAGLDRPQALLSLLFAVRAAALVSGRSAGWCAGYLSGLLIGTEIGGRRQDISGAEIAVVGTERLCALYAGTIARAGGTARIVGGEEAVLAGLVEAHARGKGDRH